MSDKRINSDESVDPRVSAAYREMADERTPEHLDHVVLNAARSAARPRRNTAIRWLRPAAWVATVGVCLAIVVEISLLDDDGTAGMDSLTPAAAPPAAVSPLTAPAAKSERLDKTAPPSSEPAAVHPVQKPAAGPAADMAADRDDGDLMERARELRQQGTVIEDTAPNRMLRMAPETSALEEALTEHYCDETQTADPNSWLECILELERQGLHEAARLERERLAEAFPPPMLP